MAIVLVIPTPANSIHIHLQYVVKFVSVKNFPPLFLSVVSILNEEKVDRISAFYPASFLACGRNYQLDDDDAKELGRNLPGRCSFSLMGGNFESRAVLPTREIIERATYWTRYIYISGCTQLGMRVCEHMASVSELSFSKRELTLPPFFASHSTCCKHVSKKLATLIS